MHKSCANIWLICPEPEKMGSNDWQVYPPIHKLHKRLVMIDIFSFHEEIGWPKWILKCHRFHRIHWLIDVYPQEEDGVTIWGPARGRSPLPQQVGEKITPVIFLSSSKKVCIYCPFSKTWKLEKRSQPLFLSSCKKVCIFCPLYKTGNHAGPHSGPCWPPSPAKNSFSPSSWTAWHSFRCLLEDLWKLEFHFF